MQFFPSSPLLDISSTQDVFAFSTGGQAATLTGLTGGFEDVLSSFIEQGRSDYSGRPAGFSGFGPTSGTIDSDTGLEISEALRKRNVSQESIDRLEALLASGAPVTMGTICTALSAKSRLTEALNDEERDAFKLLLGKLGFSKDEQDELLALSDSGDTNSLWKTLMPKLENLDGAADVTKKEWAVLLKGLDVTSGTKADLLKAFGNADEQTLSGEQLEALLAGVSKEFAARDKAALQTRDQLRDAMAEVLSQAKQREQNAAVQDNRGSRRSEQTEAFMQDSIRKNTGSDQFKKERQDDLEPREDGKSRSERILATEADEKAKKTGTQEKATEKVADKFFQRIEVAVDAPTPAPAAGSGSQAQNLNSLAQGYRREIFSQVEQGILQSSLNGSQRLTLQLNPAELGQVTVVLSVHQGEVKATIRADQQDSADVLKAQLVELKASLEAEGLKVKQLDVQTSLQENNLAGRWDGLQEHNLLRDSNERNRLLRLTRLRRETATGGTEQASAGEKSAHLGNTGLHIVA